MERIEEERNTITIQFSVITFILFKYPFKILFKYPLTIPLIFIFLSCREKVRYNKEFNHENSKSCRESP